MNQLLSGVTEFQVQGVLILIYSSHSALEQLLAEATSRLIPRVVLESVFAVGTDHMYERECESAMKCCDGVSSASCAVSPPPAPPPAPAALIFLSEPAKAVD